MAAFDRNQIERMRNAIRMLPEPTRTVYRLHLFGQLSYGAIAAQSGMTVAEVEQHVAAAIVTLGRELGRTDQDASPVRAH